MTPFTSLDQLQDPQTTVRAKFTRRDNISGDAPDWGETQTVTLLIHRYPATRKSRAMLSIVVKDFSWAEYMDEDYDDEYHQFLAEEYRMQIVEVL